MITIYTDVTCKGNPGPGGWGVVKSLAGITIELAGHAGHTTNNRMEMTTVINALTEVQVTPDHYKATPITMLTDSLQIVQGMTGWIHKWKRTGWRTASGNRVKN